MGAALGGTNRAIPAPVWSFLSGAPPKGLFFRVLEIIDVDGDFDISGRMDTAGVGVDEVSSLETFISGKQFLVAAIVASGVCVILVDRATLDDGFPLRDDKDVGGTTTRFRFV